MKTLGKITILGICGSLRKQSYNHMLLQEAERHLPEDTNLQLADISSIPLYSQDLADVGMPESVKIFREQIATSDALLISSPEYNYSIPGVLKNAIDWASRPPNQPLAQKPVAIMGASTGNFGTVRMQMHLRQVFLCTSTIPIQKPEVLITRAQEKFDAQGQLTDEIAKKLLAELLLALVHFTKKWRE